MLSMELRPMESVRTEMQVDCVLQRIRNKYSKELLLNLGAESAMIENLANIGFATDSTRTKEETVQALSLEMSTPTTTLVE